MRRIIRPRNIGGFCCRNSAVTTGWLTAPRGKTWFVLSGFRGGNIYYQKVMFSCANKVISVFSMTYPTAEKAVYEAMIETMEDHFKPGRGADTPPGC